MHGHHAACGALPAAGPYLRLSRFRVGRLLNRKDNSFRIPPGVSDSLTLPSTATSDLHRRPLRRARALGFAATAHPPTRRGLALARRRRAVGHRNPASVHPASPFCLPKMAHLELDSVGWLNKAATRPTYLKFENRSRALRPDASNHWLYPIELVSELQLSEETGGTSY
ncbi:hypothetical protein Bca4012_102899 [Brassica carinata]